MTEPIAIVGTACRFPGSSTSPGKLWDLLKTPRDVLRDFPSKRMKLSNFYSENASASGRTNVRGAAYLLDEDISLFDAAFFQINPKEASGIDPQHRLLLEVVYEAFEAAGITLDTISGSATSVHVGVMTDDWSSIQSRDSDAMGSHAATGMSRAILSNRISYTFNLKGPSMTLDTACSSSLVALHLAIQGLRSGEASQAIVAGTNLLMDPQWFIAESSLHMLSPDSRSRMFDKDANGYARGEGIAAILLKPLSQALRDGDYIECLVRQTGVNSDGSTAGITMPNHEAQSALIRQTYLNAGLDPIADRCQYYECHGTGTQAGDVAEARAISEAMFDPKQNSDKQYVPLYCSSGKTIYGHQEGCAGLAGIIRASLAIQNKIIPANLHFGELNPAIKPYADRMIVPTMPIAWPLSEDGVRRASVAASGFGGTNAHAILESFTPDLAEPATPGDTNILLADKVPGPFCFSAKSRTALISNLTSFSDFLDSGDAIDLDSLSYQLFAKRSQFSHRATISSATDQIQLRTLINGLITDNRLQGTSIVSSTGQILGIFTGQGAQTARMGYELLKDCKIFQESMGQCEAVLSSLPHPPAWSPSQEIEKNSTESRIGEAEISQPLCTAIQICLVDLLRTLGVRFHAVIGHSSGEIAAAYAAGILGRRDALGIAYYRGLVARSSCGQRGEPGGMLAASMSRIDALALCEESQFNGRLSIAASNSPTSVTISGNSDAIDEIKALLDSRQISAKRLHVKTAYHSHHMLPCTEEYSRHLRFLNVQVGRPEPRNRCQWISSTKYLTVLTEDTTQHQLDCQYWVDNMVKPVLFSEAVQHTLSLQEFKPSLAVEIGPHPALRGPFQQVLQATNITSLPYVGALERSMGAIETMNSLIGSLWQHLERSSVDIAMWRESLGLNPRPQMSKNLPKYAWDHVSHWDESRISCNYRLSNEPPHPILGRVHEELPDQKTWRHFLNLEEMQWLRGHSFQGQVVFPAAGYVTAAIAAARSYLRGKSIRSFEVQDLEISKAMVIEEAQRVEIMFTIRSRRSLTEVPDIGVFEAEFTSYGCFDGRTFEKTCYGKLTTGLGDMASFGVPASLCRAELPSFPVEKARRAFSQVGLSYSGLFDAIKTVNRSWGISQASAAWAVGELDEMMLPHPALLDTAFQIGLATIFTTAEKAGTPYLPVGIKRLIFNPLESPSNLLSSIEIQVDAQMNEIWDNTIDIDVNILHSAESDSAYTGIQVEGLILRRVSGNSAENDRNLFIRTVWDVDCDLALTIPTCGQQIVGLSDEMSDIYERVSLFYMRTIVERVQNEGLQPSAWYHAELLRYARDLLSSLKNDKHPILKASWLEDTESMIDDLCQNYPDDIDILILRKVGTNMPSTFRGESSMIEHMLQEGLLGRLYRESSGLAACNDTAAHLMSRFGHKYPRMRILEVGAGTGGTTSSVLNALNGTYSTYTCTDISAGFFDALIEHIPKSDLPKIDFKVFDVAREPSSQGFVPNSYDVVVAANVLHATRSLNETLGNVRALLKPGGYLVAIEVTGTMLKETAIMGGLEGWWYGAHEGRLNGPGIDVKEWDRLLRNNGFSGVDDIFYDNIDVYRHSCSVFVSHALDERVEVLRDPVASLHLIPQRTVVIIGGTTFAGSKLARQTEKALRSWKTTIKTYNSIETLIAKALTPDTMVLCLSDLDEALLSQPLTPSLVSNLQTLLCNTCATLWVTSGRLCKNPYSSAIVGIGRAISAELPHVQINVIDFDDGEPLSTNTIVERFLRMVYEKTALGPAENLLWTHEPETIVRGGEVNIPRAKVDHATNSRLNASRRPVQGFAGPSDPIQLDHDIVALSPSLYWDRGLLRPGNHVSIDADLSVALHAYDEPVCFLCVGKLNGSSVMLLSANNASCVSAEKSRLFFLPESQTCDAHMLSKVAHGIVAHYACHTFPSSGVVLTFGAPTDIADLITVEAASTGRKALHLVLVDKPDLDSPDILAVQPKSSLRNMRSMVPKDVKILLDFSGGAHNPLAALLPATCVIHQVNLHSLLSHPASSIVEHLAYAYNMLENLTPSTSFQVKSVNIANVRQANLSDATRLSVVVDWRRSETIEAQMSPLDPRMILSSEKTYLLVGMSGELGQSLCRFMVRGGARHIVLASRSPPIHSQWVEELNMEGANVRIVTMDVTDREQVRSVVSTLRKSMPEIRGVTNAALVFRAGIFFNLSAEDINSQLKPKINGTINLDEEFRDNDLDFFITFGSLATVCGNPGQALYHAGNLFMASLMESRRTRGKAASIINFGLLTDVGYVARMDRDDGSNIEGTLRSLLLTPLSEAEFHHVFLAGIVAGRPESDSGEVIMGMEPFFDDGSAESRPPWVQKSFFSHMICAPKARNDLGNNSDRNSSSTLRISLDDLNSTVNLAEIVEVVSGLLRQKLEVMVRLSARSIDLGSSLSSLGLDSLNAIQIRQWLAKDLGVDVPLLSILGRGSLFSLCSLVADNLWEGRKSTDDQIPEKSQAVSQVFQAPHKHQPKDNSGPGADTHVSPMHLQIAKSMVSNVENGTLITANGHALLEPVSSFAITYDRTEVMSFAQAGIHFLQDMLVDRTTFNVTAQYRIDGYLDIDRLSRAFQTCLGHHDAYKTAFFADAGKPTVEQHLVSHVAPEGLIVKRLDSTTKNDYGQVVASSFESVASCQYALNIGQTFQILLVSQSPTQNMIVFGFHLIASDAFSFSLFLDSLDLAYQNQNLPRNSGSYLDYTRHQAESLLGSKFALSMSYWSSQMIPCPAVMPLLPMAHARVRHARTSYANHVVAKDLDAGVGARLKTASQTSGSTPMRLFLSALNILLARLADISDICIGVTDGGRGATSGYAQTIGPFANILPLRFRVDSSDAFETVIESTSAAMSAALEHADVPFDVLLNELNIERSTTCTPLFQVAFNYRIGDLFQKPLGNCTMILEKHKDVKTPHDLTINVTRTASSGYLVESITNEALYSLSATQLILDLYLNLLDALCQDTKTKVQDYQLYDKAIVEKAIVTGRGLDLEHQWPSTIVERFDQVVEMFPDSTALRDESFSVSYRELRRQIDRLVSTLLGEGVASRSRIAVLGQPSVELFTTMLAVLKIGATYIPLDLTLPPTRHLTMIEVCKPHLLVAHASTIRLAEDIRTRNGCHLVNLSALPSQDLPKSAVVSTEAAAEGGIVLFTSGTTGSPKGVQLTQSGLMNYAASKSIALDLGQVIVLQQSSIGFDMSIAQAFVSIANGGTLVIVPPNARGDPGTISHLMLQHSVDFTICTPTEYHMLTSYASDTLRHCKSWRYACSGGELLTAKLTTAFRRLELPSLFLFNCYGPTEISCCTTIRKVEPDDRIPASLGKAIANTSIYILDQDGKALPTGVSGEIYVGGAGVAKGYLGNGNKDSSFVPNPFANIHEQRRGWSLMYKTGDKGLLHPDGTLLFLGRMDNGNTLLKLRGMRMDAEEVERAIMDLDADNLLADVAVSVKGEPQYLIAYAVLRDTASTQKLDLSLLLSRLTLPSYMIPSTILELENMPMTTNGKTDRQALQHLPFLDDYVSDDAETALTVPEGELRIIWLEVLGEAAMKSKITAHADFFTVGGSSLLLVRLQHTLRERIGVVMSLQELYQVTTLRNMAAAMHLERGVLSKEAIDWSLETAVFPSIEAAAKLPHNLSMIRTVERQILLTGSTAFLGGEILRQLLYDDHVEKIHCIAVLDDEQHKLLALNSQKIVVYPGSLVSENFGLSSMEIKRLTLEVDQIIHAAVQGHCMNNYTSVRQALFSSTQTLVQLAIPRRIPFHFVSAPRVVLLTGRHEAPPVSMAQYQPPTDGSQGVTSAKWASEVFLEKAATILKLPVTIHRHCALVGERAPPDDVMNSVVRFSRLAGQVPIVPSAEGYFDFRDVETVARDIAAILSLNGEAGVPTYIHHSSGVRVPISDLGRRLEELHGEELLAVQPKEWLQSAREQGMGELMVVHLEANMESSERMVFPYLGA